MCGRYSLDTPKKLKSRFDLDNDLSEFTPRYNIAPGQLAPVIFNHHVNLYQWGLVPHWAKEVSRFRLINARSETLREKPSFNQILTQRCLIPASGYFEWLHTDKEKIPYYFEVQQDRIISFAGLYDHWVDSTGKLLTTYAIITTPANSQTLPFHDRMPAILTGDQEAVWCSKNTSVSVALDLIRTYNGRLKISQVSSKVNSTLLDSPDLITPV